MFEYPGFTERLFSSVRALNIIEVYPDKVTSSHVRDNKTTNFVKKTS